MSFSWKDAQKLKDDCAKTLRKSGVKIPRGKRKHVRKRFSKPDESKIRVINGMSYIDWMEYHSKDIEPIEANPDLWEEDFKKTVDGE